MPNDLVSQIRGFLLRRPKPAKIRITTANDETFELTVNGKFKQTADSAAALSPQLIEAYDADKQLIRAITVSDIVETAPAGANLAPAVPEELKNHPDAYMLSLFANLLARAYHHSTEVAFERFLRLIELQNDRTQTVEERLERVEASYRDEVNERIRDAWRQVNQADSDGSEPSDPLSQLAKAFFEAKESGAAASQAATSKNGVKNGASRRKGHDS